MELFYNDIIINGKKLIKSGKLNIDKNTINIICGDNGSGKTLFVKNIANNKKNRMKEMVLLDQNNNVTISGCSVIESIAISDDPHTAIEIEKTLHKLGFGYLVNLKNGHLSGGEQRIINILRCFFCKSEIVILDEPTNDLDYNIVEKLIELLKTFREKKTILIVSHDDRLWKISDSMFLISANEVVRTYNEDFCNGSSIIDVNTSFTIEQKKDIKFVSRLFGYNKVSVLSLFILAIIIFLQVHSYVSCVRTTPANIKLCDDEIFLCSFHSDEFSNCAENNILPLFAIEPLMNLNLFENIKIINKITEFVDSPNFEVYDILMEDTKFYSVFPIEYFSKDDYSTINVLSYYVDKYYSGESENVCVDTSQFFTNIDSEESGENYKKVQLDINKYLKCLNELGNDESLIVSAEIVVLNNGCTASKFYCLDEIEKLASHDVLVFSNEICKLSEQLNIFKNLWNGLKTIIVSAIVLIFVNIICICMMMKDKRELIYLFRNFNYSQEEILKVVRDKMNSRKPLLIVLGIFAITLIMYMREMAFSQTLFIFLLSAIFYCSILYKLNDLLIRKYISVYYRWNSR